MKKSWSTFCLFSGLRTRVREHAWSVDRRSVRLQRFGAFRRQVSFNRHHRRWTRQKDAHQVQHTSEKLACLLLKNISWSEHVLETERVYDPETVNVFHKHTQWGSEYQTSLFLNGLKEVRSQMVSYSNSIWILNSPTILILDNWMSFFFLCTGQVFEWLD